LADGGQDATYLSLAAFIECVREEEAAQQREFRPDFDAHRDAGVQVDL
jgi:hypothetical protein